MPPCTPTKLKQRVQYLRLLVLKSMEESVIDFYHRVPSKNGRRHTEKDLWAQFAYILLSEPDRMIPMLVAKLGSPAAQRLDGRLTGTWHAYRVSTVSRDRGTRWKDPYCFPGCGPRSIRPVMRTEKGGGIPDVLLLLNPDYSRGKQVAADLFLYFELKSMERSSLTPRQLNRYLAAIKSEIPSNGFLGAIGGRRPKPDELDDDQRWLGHLSLADFFDSTLRAAVSCRQKTLAHEIRALQKRLQDKGYIP
jgi:hypothetical protein